MKGSKPCRLRPGRQDRRRAQKVAGGRGADEAAVKRAQDRRDFVVLREQRVDLAQRRRRIAFVCRCRARARRARSRRSIASPATSASSAARGRRRSCEASATAMSCSARSARGRHSRRSSCRPCGISVYSSSSRSFVSLDDAGLGFVRPPRPARARPARLPQPAPGSSSTSSARCASASGTRVRQLSIAGLEVHAARGRARRARPAASGTRSGWRPHGAWRACLPTGCWPRRGRGSAGRRSGDQASRRR